MRRVKPSWPLLTGSSGTSHTRRYVHAAKKGPGAYCVKLSNYLTETNVLCNFSPYALEIGLSIMDLQWPELLITHAFQLHVSTFLENLYSVGLRSLSAASTP